MSLQALVPRPDAAGQSTAWLRLAMVTRVIAVAIAGGLLALRPFTDQDPVLAAVALAWGVITVTLILSSSRLVLQPRAWLVDIVVALVLVLASGDWRSPFYVLALSSLILPAVMLPRHRAAGVAALFTLTYAAIAVVTGIDWATLGSTSRLESFSTHLLLPLMLVGLLAYAARLLEALAEARDRTERITLEAERRRIGLELHDSAKQRIHAAHLVLSSLHATSLNGDGSALELAMRELRAAADEMDASVAELRTTLDGRGLEEALVGRAAELQEASGVAIRVRGAAGTLPTFVAVHAYRVAAEAMTNAVRHAEAQQVEVALHADGERLRVMVTDDGAGLTDAARDSTGIASMQARARTLGGRLEFGAGAGGRGTSVLLDVPVRPVPTFEM